MDRIICAGCHTWLTPDLSHCSGCNNAIFLDGDNKNIIDRIQPNCLIYRYDGSDILEPAVIVKESKVNVKVATKLQEYAAPVVVSKKNVYAFNQTILSAIQSLRNERTATIMRYDQLIQSHWQHLQPYQ
ncbi:MAG: hypothetical protein H7X79_09395 [Sporomusaceae bacterium]|nr:hypothetical protein [Sporomusaceae bacterium]